MEEKNQKIKKGKERKGKKVWNSYDTFLGNRNGE